MHIKENVDLLFSVKLRFEKKLVHLTAWWLLIIAKTCNVLITECLGDFNLLWCLADLSKTVHIEFNTQVFPQQKVNRKKNHTLLFVTLSLSLFGFIKKNRKAYFLTVLVPHTRTWRFVHFVIKITSRYEALSDRQHSVMFFCKFSFFTYWLVKLRLLQIQ